MYKIGLVGLPNVGKTSLFKILTGKEADIKNYPFTTIDPNIGIMNYIDEKQNKISEYLKSEKNTTTPIQIIDIAGMIKGAHEGIGLGKKFLSHINEVNAICYVIRCFEDKNIIHVNQEVNPTRDYKDTIDELINHDLEIIRKQILKIEKKNKEEEKKEMKILEEIKKNLLLKKLIYKQKISEETKNMIKPFNFLTNKNSFVLCNLEEEKEKNEEIKKTLKEENAIFDFIKIKEEMQKFEENKKTSNIKKTFLDLIKKTLDLKIFLTAGKKETKSWICKKEWTAKECSGLIHSYIEKKCCGVEVYSYYDWEKNNDFKLLKKDKKVRKEGKKYLVKEWDICNFLF